MTSECTHPKRIECPNGPEQCSHCGEVISRFQCPKHGYWDPKLGKDCPMCALTYEQVQRAIVDSGLAAEMEEAAKRPLLIRAQSSDDSTTTNLSQVSSSEEEP